MSDELEQDDLKRYHISPKAALSLIMMGVLDAEPEAIAEVWQKFESHCYRTLGQICPPEEGFDYIAIVLDGDEGGYLPVQKIDDEYFGPLDDPDADYDEDDDLDGEEWKQNAEDD